MSICFAIYDSYGCVESTVTGRRKCCLIDRDAETTLFAEVFHMKHKCFFDVTTMYLQLWCWLCVLSLIHLRFSIIQ